MVIPFSRIAIIGLGLMGGSLALALRAHGYAGALWGSGGSPEDLHLAAKAQDASGKSIFTELYAEVPELPWEQLDFLILAVPPAHLSSYLVLASERLPAAAMVTDLASVKGDLLTLGESLLGKRYVSSHPLIGSEGRGFGSASAELYQDYRCVLCPGSDGPAQALSQVAAFWQFLGAELLILDGRMHDTILAATSHLPHLLAFAYLAGFAERKELWNCAGGGLRDFSRIAAANPKLWTEILLCNREAVGQELRNFRQRLAQVEEFLEHADATALENFLAQGQEARSRFLFPPH